MGKYTREQEAIGNQWYLEGRIVLQVLTLVLAFNPF